MRAHPLHALGLGLAGLVLGLACQHPDRADPGPRIDEIDSEVYRRAEAERSEFYEREVERLRADLRQAEESIVALESGLRGGISRADAVSSLAEARVALERVRRSVPWRTERVAEAQAKLEEADRQTASGNVGAAIFFISRARRITESLRAEAQQVALWDVRRSVRGSRVNLRSGPSVALDAIDVLAESTPVYPERTLGEWVLVRTPDGRIGWVHASLLDGGAPPAAPAP